MRRAISLLVALGGCGAHAGSSAPDEHHTTTVRPMDATPAPPEDASMLESGFPDYPGARALTDGGVNGGPGGMHIAWWTTASADEPSTVVAFYQRRGVALEPRDAGWHAAIGDFRLTILPSAALANFRGPGRDVPPAPGERTVLLFSRATRPSP